MASRRARVLFGCGKKGDAIINEKPLSQVRPFDVDVRRRLCSMYIQIMCDDASRCEIDIRAAPMTNQRSAMSVVDGGADLVSLSPESVTECHDGELLRLG